MTRNPKALVATLALALLVPFSSACGGGNDNLPPPPPPPPPPPATAMATPPSADDGGPPAPPPAPAVTLLAGTASPNPAAPLPTVKFVAPLKGQTLAADKAGDFQIKLDVKNWQAATGSTHVHLILDNKPYKPLYDLKAVVKLKDLPTGDALAEGQHVLVAFPSRANHESVKTKDALAVVEFFVGKSKTKTVDITKPMLVYSRPKGDYKGDFGNHVLVDFQLANDTLADGKDHVHVTVTGPGIDASTPLSADSSKFGTPYYLDNLQNGTYTVKLDLLGGDGKPVDGAWNSTTRDIRIDHDAQPDPPPAPPAADAGAPAAKPKM